MADLKSESKYDKYFKPAIERFNIVGFMLKIIGSFAYPAACCAGKLPLDRRSWSLAAASRQPPATLCGALSC